MEEKRITHEDTLKLVIVKGEWCLLLYSISFLYLAPACSISQPQEHHQIFWVPAQHPNAIPHEEYPWDNNVIMTQLVFLYIHMSMYVNVCRYVNYDTTCVPL